MAWSRASLTPSSAAAIWSMAASRVSRGSPLNRVLEMIRIVAWVASTAMSRTPGRHRSIASRPTLPNSGTRASTAAGAKLAATIRLCSRHRAPSEVSRPCPIGGGEQPLDDVGLHIIGGIVEQDPLDQVRIERDVDVEAEHPAPHVALAEGQLGPAVDGGPGPLADEAAPDRNRAGAARRMGRDEGLSHEPPCRAVRGEAFPPVPPLPPGGAPPRGGRDPRRSMSPSSGSLHAREAQDIFGAAAFEQAVEHSLVIAAFRGRGSQPRDE